MTSSRACADEILFARARLLTKRGQAEAAKAVYLDLLTRSPDHFGALNNLGALLHGMGYRAAARTAYARAVARHPENPLGHVNLANALREGGDLAAARNHCERALALAPDNRGAHQTLANILADTGDAAAAARHRQAGFENAPAIDLPCRSARHGTGTPVSVLLLVSALGGNVPVQQFLDDRLFRVSVIYADYWPPERKLPPHDIVFNAIGDADLCADALGAAHRLLARTHAPVVNAPGTVLRTGRVENAARLAHVPGVRTAKTVTLPRATLCLPNAQGMDALAGFQFPLLLRTPGYHTGRHFLRAETPGDVAPACSSLPGQDVTAIACLDARGPDGCHRKYRVMFVQGTCHPLHLAISDDWKVHYFTAAMAERADHRAEEERFLTDMGGVIGPRAMAALDRIRDTLGLDYGGIDFGLGPNREILFFEANATMVVNPPDLDERWDYRREAVARIHAAVQAMLTAYAAPENAYAVTSSARTRRAL